MLLADGRHLLTARHLLVGADSSTNVSASFETPAGTHTIGVTQAQSLTSWVAASDTDDVLLLTLSETAPVDANRYDLYRGTDEVGQSFVMVGYGVSGTGDTGKQSEVASSALRRYAENRFDGQMSTLKQLAGSLIGWTPPPDSQLWADFDNGLARQDATRPWAGQADLGLGSREGMITPGDSGSPAFVDGKIAGIASYTFSVGVGSNRTDIDTTSNNSFGEIGVWQRISHYQQWIDQTLRAAYPNAPTTPAEVHKAVSEGNAGTTYAYFLLQFAGVRADPTQNLSVDYTTRDGTAKAGSDYLPVKGTLILYPNENQAVIPVEIIGDTRPELDETVYLDVTHPVGGSFGEGVITLTAVRVILNDDGALLG